MINKETSESWSRFCARCKPLSNLIVNLRYFVKLRSVVSHRNHQSPKLVSFIPASAEVKSFAGEFVNGARA